MLSNIKYIFFGSSRLSVIVLKTLINLGLIPVLVVCPIPQKAGRGLKIKESPVKEEAIKNKIDVIEVDKLDDVLLSKIKTYDPVFLLVASFGKLLPKSFLYLNEHGALNIHPSLLPKYRGPSPIQCQILEDEKKVGVTIMKMDEGMDHGDIVSSVEVALPSFHLSYNVLEEVLAKAGAELLFRDIKDYLDNKIKPVPQNHEEATFTTFFKKQDGLIDLKDTNLKNYLKYLALKDTVGVYFFEERHDHNIRVKIVEATFENNLFDIKKVVPEGKKEMFYSDFKNGLK